MEEELFKYMDEQLAKWFPCSYGTPEDVNKRLDEVQEELEKEPEK